MPKRMLIDASHPEETRVVVLDVNRVEEFDFEAATKRPLKGNIYLAKVTRVEPSLQAAFVEYGGNRQGFLAFSEIHPDYYQIPVAYRLAILQAQTQRMMAEEDFDSVDTSTAPAQVPMLGSEHAEEHAEAGHGRSESELSDEDEGEDEDEEETDEAHPAQEEGIAAPPGAPSSETRTPAPEPAPLEDGAFAALDSGGTELLAGDQSAPREPSFVQAEATGVPTPHERRGPRNHDRPRPPRRRQYKIQEVIKRRQIMLVQVVKEERGNKGASLTTFLSLAGRYCVLMPNTPRGGGISRKITNAADRKRLKSAAQSLELPEGMGLIIRTAGANRTKLEIKRDYEYLLRLWDTVRELTLTSNAPALVYEEGSLIKLVIRDLYSKDISEIVVDGDAGYRDAKDFMRMLMPSHAKNVKPYKEALPLFQSYHVEAQLDAMFSPVVHLRSGGYIVINQTEALVSIDVNSGKATREHSIEETATKTNLEAADEIARQLRLRDLAGLIVVDFIDMEDSKNDRAVEKRLHNAVRGDRARIQIGKISQFGLLEMSRQRLRAGVLAGSTVTCPHCNGQGIIRSTESAALRLLRALDEEGQKQPAANVTVRAPNDVTIYTLNQKRRELARIEEAYDLAIIFDPQASMMGGSFEIERTGQRIPTVRPKALPVSVEAGFPAEEEEPEADVTIVEPPAEAPREAPAQAAEPEHAADGRGRKRRRRRRGGRGRNGNGAPGGLPEAELEPRLGDERGDDELPAPIAAEAGPDALGTESEGIEEEDGEDEREERQSAQGAAAQGPLGEGGDKRRRRRRRGRRGRRRDGEFGGNGEAPAPVTAQPAPALAAGTENAEPAMLAPNGESSPLWSLTDHTPAAEALPALSVAVEPTVTPFVVPAREEPEPAAALTAQTSAAPAEEPAAPPELASLPEEPAAAFGQAPVAPEEPPREARKGWWQRRFKA